jgi:IS4 transposase
LILITNNFTWTAETISELYKGRWNIEAFFKLIKQQLKIKTFVGTSLNAVMIQIWTALITVLLLKYLKQRGKYNWSMSNLIAFLRISLFLKHCSVEWLDKPFKPPDEIGEDKLQNKLFE